MNLLTVSLRNTRQRALSSALTTLSVALGAALVASLWLLSEQTKSRYTQSLAGYEAIVGPKEGSPLSLVLNTVLNLGAEPGLVPMGVYHELHDGALGKQVGIRYAIPQARGDSYSGFPVVGTTDEMFTRFARGKDEDGEPRRLRFAAGSAWSFDHEEFLRFAVKAEQDFAAALEVEPDSAHVHDESCDHGHAHSEPLPPAWRRAVIGSSVAAELDLEVGAEIVPVHGREDEVAHVHAEAISEVVGVLEPTGTPLDRSIFVPLSLFLSMEGHDAVRPEGGAEQAGAVQISAIIVDTRDHLGGAKLRHAFQTRRDAQVAWPQFEIPQLLRIVGDASLVLSIVARLVVIVAAIAICVALYNTMNERRREIAIMRALGARRLQILAIILSEAVMISLVGAVAGVLLCHAAAWMFAGEVAARTSVAVDWAAFSPQELWLIVGITAVGAVAGAIPAIKGSLTEVADNLGPVS